MGIVRGWFLAALWALCAGLLLLPSRAHAFTVPTITGHVTDTAGKLSEAQRLALDKKLEDYRECSDNEVAVLVTASLQGGNIEDAAHATFNEWKIGKAKVDDGVLLVIAPKEREIRIDTGKGVGGDLTDLQSFHIIRDVIKPRMKADQTFEAIDEGTTAIGAALRGCAMHPANVDAVATLPPATPRVPLTPPKSENPAWLGIAMAISGLFVIGVILYGALRDLNVMAAFPFAFVGATFVALPVGMIAKSTTATFAAAVVSFFGIGIPLWRLAWTQNGRRRRPPRSGGASSGGGWSSGGSSGGSSGYTPSSDSGSGSGGSSGGYTGSGYTGGGGSSGGGGASDSY